jgi:precorrin-6B methylase 2
MNFVGLKAATSALAALARSPWTSAECAQVSVSRAEPLGSDVRFVPLNPVFVVAARLAEEA